MEENETPEATVKREFLEETSLDIQIIPTVSPAFSGDDNATPIPVPFHMDLEREGFDVPHIGFFYYVAQDDPAAQPKRQESEAYDIGWFGLEDLPTLKTFDQVRVLAAHAIKHYPLQ